MMSYSAARKHGGHLVGWAGHFPRTTAGRGVEVATRELVEKPGVVLVGHIVDRIIEVEVVVVHPIHRVQVAEKTRWRNNVFTPETSSRLQSFVMLVCSAVNKLRIQDPEVDAYRDGLDRTLLRANLMLTPQQRGEKHRQARRTAEELKAAGARMRARPASAR